MYTRKFFVFFVLFATGVVSTQINIFEWLEFKLNKNTSMLKEVLGILRKEKTPHLREVAYGKNSYQSSTSKTDGIPHSSNRAVDGNMKTIIHTHFDNSPYWEVDLGKNYQIKRVEIYNRRDCCGERIHDLDITVGPSHNKMALCYHYVGPAKTGAHLIFDCQRTINGRYVNLTIKGKETLNIVEVKVYAIV
ncbi:Hypothetical predicted protein [Mytilus galloprovincialis]|uniref:Fucolectin tachylectin-4 pentraxin-1 domain-containing protein n=1 Tax=Mytilus galloprovincialis TaxID=29158 RepID=A0A8B6EHB5_MYTGA|nr:Hypothetical predicted protein [Mytilus galloprovincialis]